MFFLIDISKVCTNWLRFNNCQSALLIDILEKLYKNTTLTFEEAKTTFVTSSGVRQGGPESPNLLNLYVDFAMRLFVQKSRDIDESFSNTNSE